MLPRHVPDGVRVLVSSRTNPGVPGDVPGDHPIRHCPRRQLTPSSYARHIAVEAKNELYKQLRGGRPHEEIIGLITASGGGLTIRELAELTGRAKYDVEGQLGSLFGRSLRSRFRTEDEERAFLFAHAVELACGRVLDVGCAAGRHATVMAKHGCEVVGIDPSPGAIKVAADRGVDTGIGTILDPGDIGTFDVIVLLGGNLGLLARRDS